MNLLSYAKIYFASTIINSLRAYELLAVKDYISQAIGRDDFLQRNGVNYAGDGI